jgi:hypothetical protein
MADPEAAARRALDVFAAAFNRSDLEAVRSACNFPHIHMPRDRRVVNVAPTPEDWVTNFVSLRVEEGWHHTDFHDVEVLVTSETMVTFRLTYTRYHADGTSYLSGNALFVFTSQHGHWGRQAMVIYDA